MTPMIEKIARALCEGIMPPDDTMRDGTPYWKLYVDDARLAIAAMSEVDDAFFQRTAELAVHERFSVPGEAYPVFRTFMRAMVAAALSEEAP